MHQQPKKLSLLEQNKQILQLTNRLITDNLAQNPIVGGIPASDNIINKIKNAYKGFLLLSPFKS